MFAIEQASEHVWQLGLFFDWLTMIAVVLCIVELGLAFLRIWHGSKVSLHALARYGTLSFAAIIFTLSIAHFGRMQRLITLQYDAVRNRSVFQGNFSSDFYAMARLRTAIDCLIFVGSVALVGFTGMVFAMSLKTTAQPLKKVSRT